MRWLFEHVESRERRRDEALAATLPAGEATRRAVRRGAWGRAVTAAGALGLFVVLGVGPTPDTAALRVLCALSLVAVVGGLVVWTAAAVALGRSERPLSGDGG